MATAIKPDGKSKLLDAALTVIRTKGYNASTVDDICRAAGVSKGSFFHYFADKEALAIAAAEHFSARAAAMFSAAPYRDETDPRRRGTMVQETYATHPAIRSACDEHIRRHAADVADDVDAAKHAYAPAAPWPAESMALFTQAVLQGAFILAKAHDDPAVATDCIAHLRRYLERELSENTPR
jgi:TetR/AcrR family transcriptional repressor of nem operon